ncbi:MAG: PAS domain S-box protein [Gemmatimonadetes bacterium]|nr:PAS domain S-box protein [Gemmatimonadota bacterium]
MSLLQKPLAFIRARRLMDVRVLLGVFGLAVLLTALAASSTIALYQRSLGQSVGQTLSAIAQSQAELIRRDVHERLMDARLLSVLHETWASADPAAPTAGRRDLASAVDQMQETYDYKEVAVVDVSGRVLYPTSLALDAAERAVLAFSMRSRAPHVAPFRLDSAGGLEYGVTYPVFAGGDSTMPVVGAVHVEYDAARHILPLLMRVEGPYEGTESVIGQMEGDSISIVAPMRATTRPEARSLATGIHYARTDSGRVVATLMRLKDNSVVFGADFRGDSVIAAGTRVVGTPWLVVSKTDRASVRAASRTFTTYTVLGSLAVLLLVGLALRLIWVAADRQAKRRQFALASRYRTATTASIDGALIVAPDGRLLEANPAAAQMIGYSQTELLRYSLAELMQSVPSGEVTDWIAELMRRGSSRFHSQWRRANGTVLEVDISTSYLSDEHGGQLFLFARDVTEQIETTRRLARLNTLYAFLNRVSESLFGAKSVQQAFESVAKSALDDGRFRLCWVGLVDEAAGAVWPVAFAGAASEYARQILVTLDPALPTSEGPTGRCVREARTIVANEFMADPTTAPWHAVAREHGLAASLSLPVVVEDRVVAALMLYAGERNYFDTELVGILSEVGRLLGLVVQSVAAEERRHDEEERRRLSEERFRRLFESSPVPTLVLHEKTGVISRLNRAFTELFGYTLDDLPDSDTQTALFYPDPAYRAELSETFRRAAAATTAESAPIASPELRVCCLDGTYRNVQGYISRAGEELILSWVDLTEQRSMQATLQQAEEIAKLGSFEHYFATNSVRTSPGFLQVLGFDERVREAQEDSNFPWVFSLIHPDDVAGVFASMLRREDIDRVVRAAPDGSTPRYLRLRVRVERADEGAPFRSVGSFQDVTDEVAATTELRRLRDHLQDLVAERTEELAKANATLQAADRRLKAMLAMSQRAATLDEAAILQLGVDEAVRLTGSTIGFLHLVSADQRRVEFGTWATGTLEQSECLYEGHYDIGSAETWTAAVNRHEAVLLNGKADRSLKACPPGHPTLDRLLVVPVRDGDSVRMLLGVANKNADYDSADQQELELIGHDIWSVVQRRRADLALERAFERVKASDQRFAVAMEASSEGVWEWDIPRGEFSFNDPYATMLGYTAAEMTTKLAEWGLLLHPDERDHVLDELRLATSTDEPFHTEFRIRAKDGTYRWILSRGRVVQRDADDRALRAVGTQTDLTARRQAEDELRLAKESADAASKAKSAFLATMSHEIRTPLNGVIAMAEILAQSRLPSRDRDAVQTIQSSARALMAVIDDILDFSKIEAGRLELEMAEFSLVQLSEDLAESLLPLARSRDVDLYLFVEPEVPMRVRGDPTRLRQVLYNLTGNAIKFSAGRTGRRGHVSIRVGIASRTPPLLVLEVVDNGIGMSEDVIGHLFTSFSQAEASTTRKFGGTGLGLAITKRLVDLMDGRILVTSRPGEGATFRIELPLPIVEAAPALVPHDLTGVRCVIVVDECGRPAEDLKRLLEFAHADAVEVADLQAAVASVRGAPAVCVVIHDVAGASLTRSLEAFDAHPNVRHVALTRGKRERERIHTPTVVTVDSDVLRGRRFIRAIAVAAGRVSPEVFFETETDDSLPGVEPAQDRGLSADAALADARASGRLILVAEDDHTNQKVILQQLALLGHVAEVAENGSEALMMWRSGTPYALLLSDLHMPEMDGYTLTQKIRQEERPGTHLPIVALTANALRGEATRATAVGMDGYLTKPVPLNTLRDMIDRFILPAGGVAFAATHTLAAATHTLAAATSVTAPRVPASGTPEPGCIDVAVLAGLVGDDPSTLREFLGEYQVSARALEVEIRASLDRGDTTQAGSLAHRLKSSSRSVGALAFGDICAEMEQAGKLGDAARATEIRAQFVQEFARVDAAIGEYLARE